MFFIKRFFGANSIEFLTPLTVVTDKFTPEDRKNPCPYPFPFQVKLNERSYGNIPWPKKQNSRAI